MDDPVPLIILSLAVTFVMAMMFTTGYIQMVILGLLVDLTLNLTRLLTLPNRTPRREERANQ